MYFIFSFLAVITLVIFLLLIYRLYMQKKILRRNNIKTSANGYCFVETMAIGGFKQSINDSSIKTPKPITSIRHLLFSPYYTIKDFINTFKGMSLAFCKGKINDICNIDFLEINRLDIPVYFFHGRHDRVCSVSIMSQFFNQFDAPLGKELIWLDRSSHFFCIDDAKKVERIIIEKT